MKIKSFTHQLKATLFGGKSTASIKPPIALKHGLMVSGNPAYAMSCLNEIIPENAKESGPQIFVIPNNLADSDIFADIQKISKSASSPENQSSSLTISQVAMAIQRSITPLLDDPKLSEDKINHLIIVQSVLAYASDAKGGDEFTSPSQFIDQMTDISNPEFLLQRIINPLTVMPELGSAIRLLQAYPGFSFGLIDHARHEPGVALHEKLKGRQLNMLKALYASHAGMIKELQILSSKIIGQSTDLNISDLKAGVRYKACFDSDSDYEFLMQLFSITQAAAQWRIQQNKKGLPEGQTPPPIDLIILLDVSHLSQTNIKQDLYALAHHLWNTRNRTNNGVRLFVNWPIPWQEREQGKPMPLHGRVLQGTDAYYGPEIDVIPAFRDVFGDRSATQMNALKDKTKAEIDIIIKENDLKYSINKQGDMTAGWIIDRQLFLR